MQEEAKAELGNDRDFVTDMYNLEEEWAKQSALVKDYGFEYAAVNSRIEELKNKQAIVRWQLRQQIEQDPGAFGVIKTTEPALEGAIVSHAEYQAVHTQLLKARKRAELLKAALTSLSDKKSALENLVRLYLSSYYSQPNAPAGTEDAVLDMEKAAIHRRALRRRQRRAEQPGGKD